MRLVLVMNIVQNYLKYCQNLSAPIYIQQKIMLSVFNNTQRIIICQLLIKR